MIEPIPSPGLISDLERDEGLDLAAYPDPLTHAEPYTIGYGHTGSDVHLGLIWTQEQAQTHLLADATIAIKSLIEACPWTTNLDQVRFDALANACFNMGINRLLGFHNTLNLLGTGNYLGASKAILASAWAGQVGARATRISLMLATGARS